MTAYSVSPSGTVTTISGAGHIQWLSDGSAKIWRCKLPGGDYVGFLARLPSDHIVTFNKPVVEYCGKPKAFTPEEALDIVSRCIRSFEGDHRGSDNFQMLRTIKDELRAFDARGAGWKD